MDEEEGWYADPAVPGQSRWWSATGWTDRVREARSTEELPVHTSTLPPVSRFAPESPASSSAPSSSSSAGPGSRGQFDSIDESTTLRPLLIQRTVRPRVPRTAPVAVVAEVAASGSMSPAIIVVLVVGASLLATLPFGVVAVALWYFGSIR